MFTKEKKVNVSVSPKNSVDNDKLELLNKFSNSLSKSIAVINKNFNDLEVVKEEKVHKNDRITVCNGLLCESVDEIGISADLDKKTIVKEIDISPLDEEGCSTSTKVYSGAFKVVPYCGYGKPIYDRSGTVLAEVSPKNNVFFLFDTLTSSVNSKILEYVLDEAHLYICGRDMDGEDRSFSSASSLYKNIASKKIDQKIKAIKDTITKADDKIQLMEQKLVTMIRLKDKAEIMINNEYALRDVIAEKVKQDIGDMSKLKGFTAIRFLDDRVFGVTEEINIKHGGKTYSLGKYRIEVGFDTASVRVFNVGKNKNKSNSSIQHPHVRDNQVCMGNIQSDLPHYIAKYEFSVVFDLLYQLLNNYNQKGPWSKIENWPTV